MDVNVIEDPKIEEESYSEMVLQRVREAQASVGLAIEHYEEQRRQLRSEYAERLGKIEAELEALRKAMPGAAPKKKVEPTKPLGNTALKLYAALDAHGGEMLAREAAKHLGMLAGTVDSAVRCRPDVFTKKYRTDGVAYVLVGRL